MIVKRVFTLFFLLSVLFSQTFFAQTITGRWVVADAEISYARKCTEAEQLALNGFENEYRRDNIGKLINDYRSSGILTNYIVSDGDTSEFYECRWQLKKKKIIREDPDGSVFDLDTYELKNGRLYITTMHDSLKIKMVTILDRVPGSFKSEYSDGSFNSYFREGMPPLDRKWSAAEYKEAALAVLDIHARKISPLPHHFDSSVAILNKLTNCNDMEFMTGREPATRNAVNSLESLDFTVLQLVLAYEKESKNKGKTYYSTEKAALTLAALRLLDRTIEMKKELGIDEKRLFGSRLKSTVDGFIRFMDEESEAYSRKDVCRIYAGFNDLFTKYKSDMGADAQTQLDEGMVRIKKEKSLPCADK